MFLLDIPPETAYRRKPEGDAERIAARRTQYLQVAKAAARVTVIDASPAAETVARRVVADVWRAIVR